MPQFFLNIVQKGFAYDFLCIFPDPNLSLRAETLQYHFSPSLYLPVLHMTRGSCLRLLLAVLNAFHFMSSISGNFQV